MSGPAFAPPSADVAEMNRIHYELEYTEGISQRMRIPDSLKMGPDSQTGPLPMLQPLPQTTIMQVPERIIVAGDDEDARFSRPRDLDLIQSVPQNDLLNMKAPPRVLTLSEQPLDSLETEETRAQNQTQPSRSRRERSVSDNVSTRQSAPYIASPSPCVPAVRLCPPLSSPEDAHMNLFTTAGFLSYVQSTTRRAYQQVLELIDDNPRRISHDLALDFHDESSLVDASSLRRQIVKLNRRLQLLEEENKERSRREVVLYSATVAFWLINTWIWFRR
ncbi:unnamed protein product [Knipowitschia caucasica]|uniref:Mitochondrial fission factor n=1 Tax=Knipowitschia caucasica TaxID=637954 RepID=A0AAV2JNR2_KNICA